MSLLDNNYDFDAMESIIDFKVKWGDPINHIWGRCDTTTFNLPENVIYLYDGNILKLYTGLIDKNVLRNYITKLKEYYSIFSNRVLTDVDPPFYNYFEFYELKVSFTPDTIFFSVVPDLDLSDDPPMVNFTLEEDRVTIKGALENDIFYNVLCEIEKRLV